MGEYNYVIRELEIVLDKLKNENIDIYTHDEMMLAHTFPKFSEYTHLKGQFGQGVENCLLDFATFPGPIILTKHSLHNIENFYRGSLFTTDYISSPKGIIKIENNDLSDLKYLTKLSTLSIYDNNINIEDIKYNQNLTFITLNNCTISNTKDLPNSIETMFIDDSTITDQEVIIPYYATNIYFKKSIANNIRLKNPQILEKLFITSDVMLDLNNLKDCTNLKELTIFMSSNIKNAHILRNLPSLESIYIDEYAAIWLDMETLNTLPLPEDPS